MTDLPSSFEETVRDALVKADLPPEQMAELLPYVLRQEDMLLVAGMVPWERELARRIDVASHWYEGSKGRQLITAMPNGHLHNACAGLKRKRLRGVDPFTILAMEAEIARRDAEAKETP
jgi:hypothetical protein